MIVTLMLIPQALAYAMLAGLPPEVGLYASMLPLVVYGIFGTSKTLSVGPAAVAALMTAAAIAPFSLVSPEQGLLAGIILAALSGLLLLTGGVLKLGYFANFLSHPVISGFISAASLIIATSQLPILLGISANGENMIEMVQSLYSSIGNTDIATLIMSVITILLLVINRRYGRDLLSHLGLSKSWNQLLTKSFPAILVIIGVSLMMSNFRWFESIQVLGGIPKGLPDIGFPTSDISMWKQLLVPSLLITIVGYIESISIAQSLAMRNKSRIDPDQELIALGLSNIASSVSSGMPVTGGVSRSIVNSDAGALTPAAGILTAFGIMLASLTITQWLTHLPKLILAATIVVAVISILDLSVFKKTFQVSIKDFLALVATFFFTLFVSIEWGLSAGILISIALHIYKSSKPHIAIVGNIEGTEHFRNVLRHDVYLCPNVSTIRLDESLYFANARYLEQKIIEIVADNKSVKHIILMCPAVNTIDISAIEVLEAINTNLKHLNIGFHLSEVKGPVMDLISKSELLDKLNGKVFLTQFNAYKALSCI
jgi:sulfate permease, SulP family